MMKIILLLAALVAVNAQIYLHQQQIAQVRKAQIKFNKLIFLSMRYELNSHL